MNSPLKKPTGVNLQQQIKLFEKEIKVLKAQLSKPHFFAESAERDYDIKSKIIDKQNEIIELLVNQSEKERKV